MKLLPFLTICTLLLILSTTQVSAQSTSPRPSTSPAATTGPSATPRLNNQQERLSREINSLIELLQKEANYTESKKDYFPESETQAIITELQTYIQKLQALQAKVPTTNPQEIRNELDAMKVQTHVLRRNRLRRTAAILVSYRDILLDYITFYEGISTQNSTHNAFKPLKGRFDACVSKARTSHNESNKFITGIFSQIGLLTSLNPQQAAELERTLRNQLNEGKRTLDQTRRELRSCPDILRP